MGHLRTSFLKEKLLQALGLLCKLWIIMNNIFFSQKKFKDVVAEICTKFRNILSNS